MSGAEIKGLFDPTKATWQMIAQGAGMETSAFLAKVTSLDDAGKAAFMNATKIPAINVGSVNFTGGSGSGPNGSLSGVYMNNVGFYAYGTGAQNLCFKRGWRKLYRRACQYYCELVQC